ncbi:MAG: chitin-binding domain-containing protein [Candidatus Binatia bacterium]
MNRIKQRLVFSVGVFLVSLGTQSTAVAWLDTFCEGKELNANYKNPENCHTYVSCDYSGRAQIMPCPSGLLYREDDRPWGHSNYPSEVRRGTSGRRSCPSGEIGVLPLCGEAPTPEHLSFACGAACPS